MFPKALLATITLALSVGGAVASTDAVELAPFSAKGGVAFVQDPAGSGDARIYCQPTDTGFIAEYSVSDFFDVGKALGAGPRLIVPYTEALQGTPISAVLYNGSRELHVFFLSPSRMLSEYYWTPSTFWHGGPSCSDCITKLNILVVQNQNALFATYNSAKDEMAVGFFFFPTPGTLTEAIKRNGSWFLAPLPGY